MISYVHDTKMLNEAWKNLKEIFPFNATAPKLQFWEELNDIQQKGMSVNDYTLKIKHLHYVVSSIDK